ncbi:endonuclease [Candidatus Falkowbacteria bacterium CG10_big_fil_rev_8_21_14_0_10_39_11]|uniref:Endonuclease n=1 Tax=Candidatus Falkowbacteria bacterium CG10_big_fil_rev_8_21_14_0_10_39_11 TaxID=1974565 RepID=A0A2H0V876_9BACT|nr:MAG: endonuclease [Candidatus Falkowbacteria bacterium CG10_big_fil_rev_8_21_14_0_10_39_11]
MFFIYVIKSIRYGTRYIGSTKDIGVRIIEHNNGRCRYTKGRKPWILVYSEKYKTRNEAMKRERFLKSGQGRKYLDKVIID